MLALHKMGLESLLDKVDAKILQGCNYIVKKANEQIGCNKYDLARICDWSSAVASGVVTAVNLWVGLAYPEKATELFQNALGSGLFTGIFAFNAVWRNDTIERLEEEAGEVIPARLLSLKDYDGGIRLPFFLFSTLGGVASYLLITYSADPTFKVTRPYNVIVGLGFSLGAYFRSCDFQQRQRGKIFETLESQELVTQEVEVKK